MNKIQIRVDPTKLSRVKKMYQDRVKGLVLTDSQAVEAALTNVLGEDFEIE